ncbi:MAG: vWA domain-containing protein, partial [Spirochaetaceae bacterium]|nr:vWA domain-containing protein [Spirochaetaceae bacterium]
PPPPAPPPDKSIYMNETVKAFEGIAKEGEIRYAKDENDITPQIDELLDRAAGKTLDLVVCLDTTDSMGDDIAAVKKTLPALLKKRVADFSSFRVGFVLYKDYFEEYLYKKFDFVTDLGRFQTNLNSVRVGGGRDIPEAVYEALYAAIKEFRWTADARMVILIGDAPPHPLPRANVDKAKVDAAALELGVELDVIILPH